LTCTIGDRLFAFEHTVVEPFEGQIAIEARAHFQPLRDSFYGKLPEGEYYDLHVPAGATLGLKKARIDQLVSTLTNWIDREGPKLELAPIGLMGRPVERDADDRVPFKVKLYRVALPGVAGQLSVAHLVDRARESMAKRIRRVCVEKFPKLAVWKTLGARTALILESSDDQLTNPENVARAFIFAEKSIASKPDEIYFLISAFAPWWVWQIRVDARSFFELEDPDERGWETDPTSLTQVTAR
jgi:hypothetical protein